MKFIHILLIISINLLTFSNAAFPCHANRPSLGAWGCQGVKLPYGLCKACPMKPVKPNGDFKQCNSIFNLQAPQCLTKIKQYVQLNPCDKKRADQLNTWVSTKNPWLKKKAIEKLDYLIYALCEECCDCIPKTSLNIPWFKAKQSENLLYSSKRGNCPAHAHFDVRIRIPCLISQPPPYTVELTTMSQICKVLPNIRFFQFPNENANKFWWPKICPQLKQWMNKNPGWINLNDAVVSWPITRFLKNVNRKTSCADQQVWNRCKAMEKAQNRI